MATWVFLTTAAYWFCLAQDGPMRVAMVAQGGPIIWVPTCYYKGTQHPFYNVT